jgi:hypothetical protein
VHLRGAHYVDWSYSAGNLWNLDQTVSFLLNPRNTYWSLHWGWTDVSQSSGGYVGLQTDGNRFDDTIGDTAIFSLWDANGHRGSCGRFGGEGVGLSCRIPYPMRADNSGYRLRVWQMEADAEGQWWGAWVRNPNGTEVHIGDLRVPATATHIAFANNFSEYFGPRVTCDKVPVAVVSWANPTGNDGAVSSTMRESTKASCTGGSARLTTLADGTPAVQARLGGPR